MYKCVGMLVRKLHLLNRDLTVAVAELHCIDYINLCRNTLGCLVFASAKFSKN